MNESPSDESPVKYDALAALRQPRFILYTSGRVLGTTAQMLLQAVMAWQVYNISGSVLNLGILGLVRFLPSLGMSLIGGAAADSFNRRLIVLIAQIVPLSCGIVLAVSTFGGWVQVEIIFGLVLLMGISSSFEAPARTAMLPGIVRKETFANAVTVTSTLQSLGMIVGPGIAAGVLPTAGAGVAYSVQAGLMGGAMICTFLLRYEQTAAGRRSLTVAAIKEGILYVRQRQILVGAMSLDMFAVIFGGAQALLPVYAADILDTGSLDKDLAYGILFASLEIGAFATSLVMVFRPPIVKAGRTLVYAVAVYGVFTIAFGLSRDFWAAIILYMAIGSADMVSMVMRNVIIQLSTPDELRGRVSAVSQVFIGASNQLGAMESGFLAAVTSATFAVVSGGVAAVGVAAFVGLRLRELYEYRAGPRILAASPQVSSAEDAAGAAASS